jgi:predicted transcriptional regulator
LVRRSRVEVIVDILSESLEGTNKTRIMYRANLNSSRFNRYLSEMLERGLLVEGSGVGGGVVYRVTEKGRSLLETLRKAQGLMSV